MKTYQYSFLRYVHDVSTEEFVNIGIVMWIPLENKFLFRLTEHYARLSDFYADFNSSDYKYLIRNLKSKLESAQVRGSFRKEENISEVLPQIIPIESGCFQWSLTMSGVIDEPEKRLDKLFNNVITIHEENKNRPRRDEKDIIENFSQKLKAKGLLEENKVSSNVRIISPNLKYSYEFKYGWQNGKKQFAEPISLDYKNKKDLENRVSRFLGDMFSIKDADNFEVTGIVAPSTQPELEEEFEIALNRLRETPRVREIILENDINSFIPKIQQDIENHK